jgi:Flp pilus assembly protein TadD
MIQAALFRFSLRSLLRLGAVIGLLVNTSLYAQVNRTDLFPTNTIENQEIYGNGVLKHLQEGDAYMWKAEYEEAILAYDNAIIHSPNFAEAYLKRGISKFRIGRVTEARRDIEIASRLNPYAGDLFGYPNIQRRKRLLAFDSWSWLYKYQLKWHLNTYTNTVPEDRILIAQLIEQVDIDNFSAAQQLIDGRLATGNAPSWVYSIAIQLQHVQGKSIHAIPQLDQLASRTNDPVAQLALLQAEAENLNPEDILLSKDDRDELYPMLLMDKAIWALRTEHFEEGLEALEELYASNELSRSEVLFLQILFHKIGGQLSEALAQANLAIDQKSQPDPELHLLRGSILLLLNQPYAAIDDFNLAIQWTKNYPEAYYSRGLARILVNNRTDACYDLERSAEQGYQKGQQKLDYFCSF